MHIHIKTHGCVFRINIQDKSLIVHHVALTFFPEIILFEEILTWNKIDGMVNGHLSSCNSQQF